MKRLFHGLAACAVGLMMAVPLGAFAYPYEYEEGGFHWTYDVWPKDSDSGELVARIMGVYQVDEKGWWKPWDATSLVVPATLPVVGTNEFARAESVYDEYGFFLSNKYVTVYGPEVKSVVATVVYLDVGLAGNETLTSVTIPESVEEVTGGFSDCKNLSTVTMGSEAEFSHRAFANTPWLRAQGEFVVRDDVLVAYQGTATSVTVPDGITKIADGAFGFNEDSWTNLTSVTLPVGLEEIGMDAFSGCENLASINLPDSLRRIDDYAFMGCYALTKVVLPARLKYLGSYTYCWCTGVTSVVFSEGLKGINEYAFYKTGLTAIDIPASVKSIDGEAFASCEKLATVTGGVGLEWVSDDAFDDTAFYKGIKNDIVKVGAVVVGFDGTLPETLVIPEGVTVIQDYALSGNSTVTTLELPSTLKEIGGNALSYSPLETVKGGSGVVEVGDGAFDAAPYGNAFFYDRGNKDKPFELMRLGRVVLGYTGVCPAEIVIPDDVASLAAYVFFGLVDDTTTNVTSVVVGSGVKSIHNCAFWYLENLKTATVSGALKELGVYAFSTCTNLTDVTLTGSYLGLDDEQFAGCKNLASMVINLVDPEEDDEDDEPVLYLSSSALNGCDKLTSVKVNRPGFQLTNWSTRGALDEEIVFADEVDTFRLWRVDRDSDPVNYYSMYFAPKWKRVLRNAENDAPFTAAVATTYIGWISNEDGSLAGSVSVTVKKAKKGATSASATVKVTVLGEKKVTLKGTIDANGNGQGDLAGLVLTANGLAGTLTVNGATYAADGARDVAKTSKDPEQSVFKELNKKVWTLALAPMGDNVPAIANGFAGLSVSMGSKGKAKLSGTLPDGTKLNINGQTVVGEYNCCIPFVYSKPKAAIGFLVWVDRAGAAVDVTSISKWKGKPTGSAPFAVKMYVEDFYKLEAIPASTKFYMDPEDLPTTLEGVQAAFLPTAEPVSIEARKWTLAKAATVKYKKGVFDQAAYDKSVSQGKTNNASLKLKYTAKSGLFSGSFTIFTLNGTSMKKVTANVNGVVCDGVGYGSAVIKKQGAMPVVIGEIEEDDEDW